MIRIIVYLRGYSWLFMLIGMVAQSVCSGICKNNFTNYWISFDFEIHSSQRIKSIFQSHFLYGGTTSYLSFQSSTSNIDVQGRILHIYYIHGYLFGRKHTFTALNHGLDLFHVHHLWRTFGKKVQLFIPNLTSNVNYNISKAQ